jgi:hypothetical protein
MRGQGKKKVLINIASALLGWVAVSVNVQSARAILAVCNLT